MSPILEIALTIVFCLWIIPITWAVSTVIRSLPVIARALINWTIQAPAKLLAYIKLLPLRYEADVENRQKSRENAALEGDYRRLQDALIGQRQLVAHALATKSALESKVRELTEETQQLHLKSIHPSVSQEEKQRVATNLESLHKLERELSAHVLKLQSLKYELEEKEAAVQSAYTSKQVQIATNKADAATKNLKRLLANDPTAAVIRRMEEKVVKREVQAYAIYFLEDHHVSFPSVAKAIERLSIDKLELEELKALLEALDEAASELHSLAQSAVAYERILRSQAETNAESAQEFQTMLVASKICTDEFIKMHTNFAQKEREIFNRIAELDALDAKDSDFSRECGDLESGE
jgi:hypothetical protein